MSAVSDFRDAKDSSLGKISLLLAEHCVTALDAYKHL
jgi:hypothetical protein